MTEPLEPALHSGPPPAWRLALGVVVTVAVGCFLWRRVRDGEE